MADALKDKFMADEDGYQEVGIKAVDSGGIGQTTVGTTAVQITEEATYIKSVSIKALATNTGKVYIGSDNTVTVNTGYELLARDSVDKDIANLADVWLIADTASQKICYMTVT